MTPKPMESPKSGRFFYEEVGELKLQNDGCGPVQQSLECPQIRNNIRELAVECGMTVNCKALMPFMCWNIMRLEYFQLPLWGLNSRSNPPPQQ